MLSRAISFLGRMARGGVLRARSPASSARIVLPVAAGPEPGKGDRRLRGFKHFGSVTAITSALVYLSFQVPVDENPPSKNRTDIQKNQENGIATVECNPALEKETEKNDAPREDDAIAIDDDPFDADMKYYLSEVQKQWSEEWHSSANHPEHVDWVQEGAVTPVLEQKLCGCCGCIASIGAVEGIHKIKKGTLLSFSTQQLIDCDKKGGSCEGCYAYHNFMFMSRNGIVRAEDYPYKAEQGPCMSTEDLPSVKISGYVPVKSLDEEELRLAVARQPVVVHVYPNEAFSKFKGDGIIELEDCPPVDNPEPAKWHAVLVVAYGVDPDGRKWWKIKNSWGPTWGDGGYAKIRRDVSDPRGVASITMLMGFAPVID